MEYQSSRSFPVEFAALGFLIEGDALHGYDLRQRMEVALGSVWHVALSQLYNVLRRLSERGWVSCRLETQEGAPPRRVCEATAQGRRAFLAWARSPVDHLRDLRVEFIAKAYLLRRIEPEALPGLISAQIALYRGTLDSMSNREQVETDDPRIGKAVLSFRKQQLAGAIAWLEESRAVLLVTKEED
jgi:PadR family transcriptional regulator AphA